MPSIKDHHNNSKFHCIAIEGNGDKFKTLHTDSGGGQKKYQGYNPEGHARFIALRKSCKRGRKSNTGEQKEKAVLAKLREFAGITAETWEDHQKSLGRKPAAEAVVPDEVQGLDIDDSDVESEATEG